MASNKKWRRDIDTSGAFNSVHGFMRFPLALTTKIAGYIIGHKLRGTKKFATVLQLEPLHTCNLTCTGCGRIREYSTSLKDMMSLEECLGAAEECNAPMISICGGEPLIYPHIEALVNGLLDQGRIVYVCTNAMFMRKKMREWLKAELRKADTGKRKELNRKIDNLVASGLVSEKDAAANGKACSRNAFSPLKWRRSSAIKSRPTRPSTKRPIWMRSSRCSIISPISAWTVTRSRRATITTPRKRT